MPCHVCVAAASAAASVHDVRWVEKDFAGEMVERRRVKVQGADHLYDPKVRLSSSVRLSSGMA